MTKALSRTSKLLLMLLLALAALEFAVRGPVRFLRATDFNDFISPYIQSKALLVGVDPYSPQTLIRLWPEGARHGFLAEDLGDGSLLINHGIPTAYPPTCLFLLTPLALLSWPFAHLAWLITTLVVLALLIRAMLQWAGLGAQDWRAYLFVAFALALAPFHTGVGAGSIVIVTVCLGGIALLAAQRRNEMLAGFLFGLAVCLKPQIGLPFLAYYVLRRRWRLCFVTAGVVLVAGAVPLARLGVGGTPWLRNYQMDNRILLSSGILSDFTERNPIRFSLINLQVLIYALSRHAAVASSLALLISGAAFLVWIVLVRRNELPDALLEISAILVLSLLPVYHRLYDASLLIFPVCWGMREFSGRFRLYARATLLLILPFLVPGGSALEQLQVGGYIPETIAHSWYWTSLALPHQVWLLVLLSLLLLQTLRVSPALKIKAESVPEAFAA